MHVFLIAEYAVVHNYATNTCIVARVYTLDCSNRPFMNSLLFLWGGGSKAKPICNLINIIGVLLSLGLFDHCYSIST